MTRVVTIGTSKIKGPLSWPVFDDTETRQAFLKLAEGAWVDDQTIEEMERVGRVFLPESEKERIRIVTRGHVAEARWYLRILKERQGACAKLRHRKALNKEVVRLGRALSECLQKALKLGVAPELNFWAKCIAANPSMVFAETPGPSIAQFTALLDTLVAASAQPLDAAPKFGRGRPRPVDWDTLFVCLARIYSEAGGRVSLSRNSISRKFSRFIQFVDVLRNCLPPEAQGSSIETLAERARNGEMESWHQSALAEIMAGGKST